MNTRTPVLALVSASAIAVAAFALTAGVPNDARAQLFDPKDTLVLLLDHQTGLFQTVKDIPIAELRANTVVLAKIAELAKRRFSPPRSPTHHGPLMSGSRGRAERRYPHKEVSAWDTRTSRRPCRPPARRH
jgi:hypothetical protein